jgi:fatty acid desaturase
MASIRGPNCYTTKPEKTIEWVLNILFAFHLLVLALLLVSTIVFFVGFGAMLVVFLLCLMMLTLHVIAGFMRERKPGYFAARQDENSGSAANGAGMNLRAVAKCSGMRRWINPGHEW